MASTKHPSDWGWQLSHLDDAINVLLAGCDPATRQRYLLAGTKMLQSIYSPLSLDLASWHQLLEVLGVIPDASELSAIPTVAAMAKLTPADVQRRVKALPAAQEAQLATVLDQLRWPEEASARDPVSVRILSLVAEARVLHRGLTAAPLNVHDRLIVASTGTTDPDLVNTVVMTALAITQTYATVPMAVHSPTLSYETEPYVRTLVDDVPAEPVEPTPAPGRPPVEVPPLRLLPELDLSRFALQDDVRGLVEESEHRIVEHIVASTVLLRQALKANQRASQPRWWQWHERRRPARIEKRLGQIERQTRTSATSLIDELGQVRLGNRQQAFQLERLSSQMAELTAEVLTVNRESTVADTSKLVLAALQGLALQIQQLQDVVVRHQDHQDHWQASAMPLLRAVGDGAPKAPVKALPVQRSAPVRSVATAKPATAKPAAAKQVAPRSRTSSGVGALFGGLVTVCLALLLMAAAVTGLLYLASSSARATVSFPTFVEDALFHRDKLNGYLYGVPTLAPPVIAPAPSTTPTPNATAAAILATWNQESAAHVCFMPVDITRLVAESVPATLWKSRACPVAHLTPALFATAGGADASVQALAKTSPGTFWSRICIAKPDTPATAAAKLYQFHNVPKSETLRLVHAC